jgi:hypothetical protein
MPQTFNGTANLPTTVLYASLYKMNPVAKESTHDSIPVHSSSSGSSCKAQWVNLKDVLKFSESTAKLLSSIYRVPKVLVMVSNPILKDWYPWYPTNK